MYVERDSVMMVKGMYKPHGQLHGRLVEVS